MKKLIMFLFVIVSLVLITACTEGTSGGEGGSNDNNSSDSNNDNSNGDSGKDSIVIGFEADATTMLGNWDVNYINQAQIRNIFDSVIDRDPSTGELIPALTTYR